MRTYKLQNTGAASRRRPEVREKHLELNPPAIIICILIAIAVWLYVVSFLPPIEGERPMETLPPVDETTPTASDGALADGVL